MKKRKKYTKKSIKKKVIITSIILILLWIFAFYLYITYQNIEVTPSNYEATRTKSTTEEQTVESEEEKSQTIADMLEETTRKVVGISKLKNTGSSIFSSNSENDLGLGTGVGGAVVINNALLDTGDLPGCEIGHMVIESNGIQCKCGRKGCFEKYASMKAFKDNLRNVLNLDEKTSGKDLLDIIRKAKNDKESKYEDIEKVIDTYINYLALGIANLVNIFEPEAIAIGGSFVYFEEELLDKLKTKLLEKNMLFNERKDIILETAILDNDAGIIGSVI